METINLPEGNAFGVDDVESGTPIVDYAEHQAKTLFFVWVTLTEQKWVIFGERRGPGDSPGGVDDGSNHPEGTESSAAGCLTESSCQGTKRRFSNTAQGRG